MSRAYASWASRWSLSGACASVCAPRAKVTVTAHGVRACRTCSVKHKYEGVWGPDTQLETCNDAERVSRDMPSQRIDQGGEVIFTYDVKWEWSDEAWSTRWDLYNKISNSDIEIHWLSIVNSVLIVFFLTGMIAMILMRALYKDIAKYNAEQVERGGAPHRSRLSFTRVHVACSMPHLAFLLAVPQTLEQQTEETGWKLVYGDVFRAPTGTLGPMSLSVTVGSGIQVRDGSVCERCQRVMWRYLGPSSRMQLGIACGARAACHDGVGGHCLRLLRLPVAGQPWWHDDGPAAAVCVHGQLLWLR